MQVVEGDIWEYHAQGAWIIITTNAGLTKSGLAVMGRGVALQASERFPTLRSRLGAALRTIDRSAEAESIPCVAFEDLRIICFPVKWTFYDDAELDLIEASARHCMQLLDEIGIATIYSVKPGCGSGHLLWSQVQPILAPIFNDRVTIVDLPETRAPQ